MMRVTILGSGTAVPVADRFPPGVLVQAGGTNVLVDVGPGVLRQLPRVGLDLGDIDAVLLTHFHVDHCADLAALKFGLLSPRYAGRGPLVVRGGTGLLAWTRSLTAAWKWMDPRGCYELDEREIGTEHGRSEEFEIAGLTIRAVAVDHRPESLAYRLTDPSGASVAVSGDARPCPGLAEVARGVDLFVCESAFPEAHRHANHLTPRLAAEAAAAAGAAHLCLTHFYPECEGHDLVAEARAAFPGPITLAEDLMAFDLPPGSGPRA